MRHYLGQVDDLDIKAAASIAEITSLVERADGSIVVAMPMVVVAKEFGARAGSTYTGQGADRYAVVTREDAQRVGAPILADPWAAYQAGQALPGPQAAQVKGRRIPIPQEGRRWVPWAIVGGGMAVALGAMFVLSSKKSVKPNRRRSSRRLRRNVSKRSITRNGTAAQHAAMSNKHLEAAREELEWLRHGPAHNAATKKKLVAKIRRHLDQAASECWWTRGKAKARCEDEVRRLDAELAAVTRKKRTSKRMKPNASRRRSSRRQTGRRITRNGHKPEFASKRQAEAEVRRLEEKNRREGLSSPGLVVVPDGRGWTLMVSLDEPEFKTKREAEETARELKEGLIRLGYTSPAPLTAVPDRDGWKLVDPSGKEWPPKLRAHKPKSRKKRRTVEPNSRRSSGKKPVTKKGEYGTLYLYEIEFDEGGDPDPGEPPWMNKTKLYGYDRDHAIERFYDSYYDLNPGNSSVTIKSATRVMRYPK